jgi:hypothetical protein
LLGIKRQRARRLKIPDHQPTDLGVRGSTPSGRAKFCNGLERRSTAHFPLLRALDELPEHEEIVPEPAKPVHEFEPADEEPDDEVQRQRIMQRTFGTVARQVSLDPGDDMQM